MKDQAVRTRITVEEKTEVEEISEKIDIPVSQIIREGLRLRIDELKRTHPLLQETQTIALGK